MMWYKIAKKKSNKIVFLDFDGVLNDYPNHDDRTIQEVIDNFDKFIFDSKVKMLNKIVDDCNADFIIISYWRRHFTKNKLSEFFKKKGFKGNIIDFTGLGGKEHKDRLDKIKKCLEKYKPDSYVILDDSVIDETEDDPNHIRPEKTKGLEEKHIDKAISILNGEK